MCEALSQRGNSETSMLILHKILAKAKDFNTQNPQRSDYQKLNAAYQKALAVENLPACSLQEAQDRLAELGSSIRSYGKSNMRSLNEAGEYGSELIDRFSQHNYSTPLENCLKLERQAQAENLKRQVHQQLNELSPIDLEAFWLKASGYNDSTIAQAQSIGAGSTVKRRRDRTISKLMKVPINKNFSTIADSYMEVAKDYFEFNTRWIILKPLELNIFWGLERNLAVQITGVSKIAKAG